MQKRFGFKKLVCLAGSLLFAAAFLCACGPDVPPTPSPTPTPSPSPSPSPSPTPTPSEEFKLEYRSDYTPTYFTKAEGEFVEIGAGVHLVTNTVTKTNGDLSVVYAIEVDLREANIVAGTKDNASSSFAWGKAVPYQTALDWEKATGGHVYASINADFFGSTCVNAFVKDGYIVKASHNDKGTYVYTDEGGADVPASAPMLFGVKGDKAQIGPMLSVEGDPTEPAVKEQFVKGKLCYTLNGTKVEIGAIPASSQNYYLLGEGETATIPSTGAVALKLDTTKGFTSPKVLEKQKYTSKTSISGGAGYVWLFVTSTRNALAQDLDGYNVGDSVPLEVSSPDGAWNGFETILGCRHALVIDSKLAPTISLEMTNGAKRADVPRSAVGIKDEHTVVVFGVESLYYYGKADDDDTHGMNLEQLADFIAYYGCTQAANFDGGGSTQLVVRAENEKEGKVYIRSADTASAELMNTRPVMNSLLVVKREK